MTRSGSGPLPVSLSRFSPLHFAGPYPHLSAASPAQSTYAASLPATHVAPGAMPGLRQFRALHRPTYDLLATHVRNALRDHREPEHFLSQLVLDPGTQAPPIGAIMHTMLHADAQHPPLRVLAAMIPLLVEGVRSYAALHRRLDPLPRVAAFLALISLHLPSLTTDVRRGALALRPLTTPFVEGAQRATARAVASQLTDLIYYRGSRRPLRRQSRRSLPLTLAVLAG